MEVLSLEEWSIESDVFDGPLDLLLYLVRRDGIDLRDLEIAPIADAYLSYVDRMRRVHLGVAAEYLVMAATLVYLKSLDLLPRPPTAIEEEDEDVEDPRDALARRLIEYERYRDASMALDDRAMLGRDVFSRPPDPVDDDRAPVAVDIDAFGLLDLYYDLMTRAAEPEPQVAFSNSGPDFAVCCRRVLHAIGAPGGRADLGDVLRSLPTMPERVVTFVAVLEMARLQWLDLTQDRHLAPVELISRVEPDQDLSVLTGRLEAEAVGT